MKLKNAAVLAAIPLGASLVGSGGLADTMTTWDNGYGHMAWGGGYGMLGGFMMLVFWGVIIALIVVAVRWFGAQTPAQGKSSDAVEILKARFAKGEIDEEEFRKRKAALDG